MLVSFNSLAFPRLKLPQDRFAILRNLCNIAKVKMPKAPTFKLNDGFEIPVVGLGTYASKSQPGQFKQATEWGIEAGYRHIDTAAFYGNEEELGEAIANKIADGTVTRDELFVTTKLWNDKHARSDVVPSLKESLRKLRLDFVNLYLIHWPVSVTSNNEDAKIDFLETWAGMEEAQKLGLARSIGVSNFNEKQLTRVLQEGTVKPVVNQIEINPTHTQESLVKFCQSQDVVPTAYTPLGRMSGLRRKADSAPPTFDDPFLTSVGQKYGKNTTQVVLRYLIDRGIVAVPKSFTKHRIEENLNLFDFKLSPEEVEQINKFNQNDRCVPADALKVLSNYPF